MEVTTYTIDGIEYLVVDQIQQFLYLSNASDEEDMMIRKVSMDNDEQLLPLDSDEEFEKALLLLTSKKIQEIEE